MGGRPVRGHIALWLIGQSTDDPRVHDMLRTLTVYQVARLIGPSVYHYGKMAAFVPSVAWHYWRGPKHPKYPSGSSTRYVRVTSPHGEWPVRWEYTKPRVTAAIASKTPRAFGIGGLSWLSFGTAVHVLKPSFEFLSREEVVH